MKAFLLTLLAVGVYLLHQDYWNWNLADPLIFGFLPIGLAWQGGFSILCAVMLWIFTIFAWPEHLEQEEAVLPAKTGGGH